MIHTPVPWAHKRIPLWTPSVPTDGIPAFVCNEYGGEHWLQQAKANAAFIVRAVNSHDELLEACRAALMQFEHNGDECPEDQVVLNSIQAAIAKATGS